MDPYTFIQMLLARRAAQQRGVPPPAVSPQTFGPRGPGVYGRAGGGAGTSVVPTNPQTALPFHFSINEPVFPSPAPIEERNLVDRQPAFPAPVPPPTQAGQHNADFSPNISVPPPMNAPAAPGQLSGNGPLNTPITQGIAPPADLGGSPLPALPQPTPVGAPSAESDAMGLSAGRQQMIVDQLMRQKASRDAMFARYGNLMRPEWSRDFPQ